MNEDEGAETAVYTDIQNRRRGNLNDVIIMGKVNVVSLYCLVNVNDKRGCV